MKQTKVKKLKTTNSPTAQDKTEPSLNSGNQSAASSAAQPTASSSTVTVLDCPPPEHLLELALGEPNRKLLQGYGQVIQTLRDEKGFSFREIAEWLTENGVDADYNGVYRVYTKGMSEGEAAEVAHYDDEQDRETA